MGRVEHRGGRADGVRTELHMFPAVSLPGRNPPLRSPRKQQVIIRRVANPEQNKSTFLFSCLQKTVLSPTSAVPDRGANISSLLHKSGVSWAIRESLLQHPPITAQKWEIKPQHQRQRLLELAEGLEPSPGFHGELRGQSSAFQADKGFVYHLAGP